MQTFLLFWGGPALFVFACVLLLVKCKAEWKRASLYGIMGFVLFLVLGSYSILQSRSSTAGIGFIFLPIIALIPGGLGFALGKIHSLYLFRNKNNHSPASLRIGLAVVSLLMIAPFIWLVSGTLDTIAKNRSHDIESARQSEAIKNNIREIESLLLKNPGKEAELLQEMARETDDRTWLIPIAKNKHTSAAMLSELGKSNDFGVALNVVRNRNTEAVTLEWIYRNHSYPPYFYSDLSSNPNTPTFILYELYEKRDQNSGIAWQLARNPKLPKDIVDMLASEPRKYVLRDILDRTDLTCEQVNKVIVTINNLKDTGAGWLVEQSKKRMENCI